MAMIRTETRLPNAECTAHQRLGLGGSVGVSHQTGQIVDAHRDNGVITIEALFPDPDCTLKQRLGFGESAGVLQEDSQVIKECGDL